MKIPLRNQIAYISLLLVTTFLSCQKDSSLVSDPSIAQAKAYFETHLQHQHEPSPKPVGVKKQPKRPFGNKPTPPNSALAPASSYPYTTIAHYTPH